MPEVDVATKRWRGIDELARLIGAYCWVENRLFALTGTWASAPAAPAPDAEIRVLLNEMSAQHAAVAVQ